MLASLGCGNPTALAQLNPGETVLDLGSGGGIDVLLSARRVGPTGKAYGLDMTDEMLALARENQRKAGVENVEFLKGEIENIPLPDNSVDVVISNCVINLSGRQGPRAARSLSRPEARRPFRGLRCGGPRRRARRGAPQHGAVGGLHRRRASGLRLRRQTGQGRVSMSIDIEPTRVYNIEDARQFLAGEGDRRGRDRAAGGRQIHERLYPRGESRNRRRSAVVRRAVAEALGTAFLLAAVVGSGIMGERLAGGNVAIALLANTIATGAALVALILTFGPISGAHFNPAVTLADASQGGLAWREVPVYIAAQIAGAFAGVAGGSPDVRRAGVLRFAPRPRRQRPALQRICRDLRAALRHLGLRPCPIFRRAVCRGSVHHWQLTGLPPRRLSPIPP